MATINSTLSLTDKMSAAFAKIQNAAKKTEATFESVGNKSEKMSSKMSKASSSASSMFSSMLKANLVANAISKLSNLIMGQLSNAVARFDTLNNYTKVMHNLGVSEEAANISRERLASGLKGLPTTLDAASLAVQRFTAANGNVEASTEMYLALNNALLAGGTSQELQASAMEQWAQAYSAGKPDMMEWRALLQAMPGQLKQIAKAMNKTTDQLGADLRSGKTSMNEFMKTAIKLNQEGIDGFENFEEQAKKATDGIGTAIANLKSAISRGWTKMFEGANKALEASGLPTLSEIIKNLGNAIEDAMTTIGTDALPTLGISLQGIIEQFQMFDDVGRIIAGDTVENTNTMLSAWDYLMIGAQALGLGIQAAIGIIQLAYLHAQLGAMALVSGTLGAFYMLQNGIEGVMTGILIIIQTAVNNAIGVLNTLIDAFNFAFGAFGANAQKINKMTFGDEAVANLSKNAQDRNDKLYGYATKMQETAAQIKEFENKYGQNLSNSATNIQKDVLNRQARAAAGGGAGVSGKYDPNNIDKLANTVGNSGSGGNGGGKAVKTTSTDKNLLSDDDVQLLLDVATRDYKLNYQQVTPNITLTFGDIRETVDVDDVLDRVADKLEDIYDGNLEVA